VKAILALLGTIALGIAVNELSDVSPWLARKLVTVSARIRYGDTARSEVRTEELTAVIADRPGKVLKLGTALWFVATALAARLSRAAAGEAESDTPSFLRMGELPSELVAQYLFPTELFRGEWRRHWIHLAKSWALTLLIASLAIPAVHGWIKPTYANWLTLAIVLGGLTFMAFRGAGWYLNRFVLSNRRLMYTEGVVRRRVGMMPLMRVVDLRYEQSGLGRMLNYGTFFLESVSRVSMLRRIVDLPSPNELYLRVVEEMYEPEAVEARIAAAQSDETDEPSTATAPDADMIVAAVARLAAAVTEISATLSRWNLPVPRTPSDGVSRPETANDASGNHISENHLATSKQVTDPRG
jgi:hypothetical protein